MDTVATACELAIEAEQVDREVRRIRYQMSAAKFPHHKDFSTFDYSASAIDKTVLEPLSRDKVC